MSDPNPWEAVAQLRWQYEQRIGEELRVQEKVLANRDDANCKCEWNEARKAKGKAYRAYVHAVHAAVKSGVPRPADE